VTWFGEKSHQVKSILYCISYQIFVLLQLLSSLIKTHSFSSNGLWGQRCYAICSIPDVSHIRWVDFRWTRICIVLLQRHMLISLKRQLVNICGVMTFSGTLQWRLVCRHCGTAVSLISRYISFLGQFIVLLWYFVLHAQYVLTMRPPCTKRFAQS